MVTSSDSKVKSRKASSQLQACKAKKATLEKDIRSRKRQVKALRANIRELASSESAKRQTSSRLRKYKIENAHLKSRARYYHRRLRETVWKLEEEMQNGNEYKNRYHIAQSILRLLRVVNEKQKALLLQQDREIDSEYKTKCEDAESRLQTLRVENEKQKAQLLEQERELTECRWRTCQIGDSWPRTKSEYECIKALEQEIGKYEKGLGGATPST